MNPFHSKAFVFFAVSVMVISGAAVYLSVSAVSGNHAFVPVQPHTNPVSFNPAETVDSTGSPHGVCSPEHTPFIGNASWCAVSSTLNSIFDLGQSACISFGGLYNNSYYPSGGIFLDIYNPSMSLIKQCHTDFIASGTTYSPSPPVVCSFSTTGKYQWQLQVCIDPSIKEIQYSALEPLTVNADPTIATPTASPSHNPLETRLPVSITFSTTESGGTSPLSYQWDINGTGVSGATSNTFTHTFSGYATYTITVNVTDATGYKVTSTALVEVIYPPLSVSLSVSPNPADIGESVKLTASASGGSGSYSSFVFSIAGSPHVDSISITTNSPNASQTYQQMITVKGSTYGINSQFSNIQFVYSNGTHIYAWIQSINTTSTNATIWLKLYSDVNQTINMQVYPQSDNFLSATGYVGYGAQDIKVAQKIFPYITDFSNLTGWTTYGSGTVKYGSSGLNVTGTGSAWTTIQSNISYNPNNYVLGSCFYDTILTGTTGQDGMVAWSGIGQEGTSLQHGWESVSSGVYGLFNWNGPSDTVLSNNSNNAQYSDFETWVNATSSFGTTNFGSIYSNGVDFEASSSLNVIVQVYLTDSIHVRYVYLRNNLIMPTISIGTGSAHSETTSTYTTSFSSSGSYPMNVSVTDSAGYTAYSLNITEVVSSALAAVISSNVSETEVGFGVEFMSSVAGGTPPYTYSWSVSDNGQTALTGTGSDINYTDPTEAGTLSAKLTVKDSQTGVYTAYKNITVLPDVELVNFSLSNSVRWVVSESVTVYGNITGGLGPYSVYLLIGATTANGVMHSNISGPSFSYTFVPTGVDSSGGIGTIVVYDSLSYSQSSPAKGPDGYSGRCYSLSEPVIAPYVKIAASPQSGIAPLTVDFTGFIETSTSGATNSPYNWTFSNGVNTLTQNPVETFPAGNYTATLTADDLGVTNSASLTITALPLPATFSYSPHTGGTVLTDYNFTAKIAYWVTAYNITWTFPDGTQQYGNITHYRFSSYSPVQNVSAEITYTNGSYTSYLNVKMTPAAITANFSIPAFLPVQTLISVNATVNDPDSTQITYLWTFNGQNYTGAQQLFYLGNPQEYNITLKVTDQYGMTYSITKNVTAVIPSNDGNITLSIIQKSNGPYTTYDIQIYSKDGISVVEALLGSQTLTPSFVNDSDGYWYQLTLNQESYYAGTYSLEFIVFDKAAQSNSKTVSFFVSQTYGKSSGQFSLASFFGSTETEIIALLGVAATIGTAIVYSRDKKDRDTQYLNINGDVLKAKRTPGTYNKFKKRSGGK
jgi:hypothetical protein